MALTLETAGALVSGGSLKKEKGVIMETTRIKALRPFYYQGVVLNKGQEIEVGKIFAIDMVTANKAEIVIPIPTIPSKVPLEEKVQEAESPVIDTETKTNSKRNKFNSER